MRPNKQHQSLFNPEYNFNHKVVQVKKHKLNDKFTKEEVEEFLRTQGDDWKWGDKNVHETD